MAIDGSRPLQARAEETRAALLEAALECLVERGYAATTTIEIARRAGVSRGAQLYHFPSKAQLLAAVVEHLKERRVAEFRDTFARADITAVGSVPAAIDLMWSMYQGPVFIAWAELWVAARTDRELADALIDSDRRFAAAAQAVYREIFPPKPGTDPAFDDMPGEFAFALMDGLAFQRLIPRENKRPATDFLEALKFIAELVAVNVRKENP